MVRKGQVRKIGGRDMKAQAVFVAELFQLAASPIARRKPTLGSSSEFATEPATLMPHAAP